MDKKKNNPSSQTNRRTSSSSSSSTKTSFGASGLQISGDDALHLVGRIVEKGVSDEPRAKPYFSPVAPPKPSALPFPVARHRSHGPHWAPVGSEVSAGYGEDDYDGLSREEKVFMDSDPIAPFANPVKRRNRKDMDFSSWKEILTGNSTSVMAEKPEGNKLCLVKTEKRKKAGEATETARNSEENESSSVAQMELDYSNDLNIQNVWEDKVHVSQIDLEKKEHDNFLKRKDTTSALACSGYNFGNEQEAMSLESQIDAENQERLKGMSPDEVAEARAEIMEKMNPELVRLLKKRGEEKLKKQKSPSSEMGINVEPSDGCNIDKNDARGMSVSESHSVHMEKGTSSKEVQSRIGNGEGRNLNPVNSSLWNAWSERVEGARGLRFSLDGAVVENDLVKVADTDCVAERDFLRTEGDPGAAGYTIKEAVALTRSVIPGQRALALHILFAVLDSAVQNVCQGRVGHSMTNEDKLNGFTDWEAIWAYALGPEPELILSLRCVTLKCLYC